MRRKTAAKINEPLLTLTNIGNCNSGKTYLMIINPF